MLALSYVSSEMSTLLAMMGRASERAHPASEGADEPSTRSAGGILRVPPTVGSRAPCAAPSGGLQRGLVAATVADAFGSGLCNCRLLDGSPEEGPF